MSSSRLEVYQDTFGMPPDQMLALYETCTPDEWRPITHHQVRGIGREAVQSAIFYSSFEHCNVSGNGSVFAEASAASDYVVTHVPDLDNVAVNVEGRVRRPPKLSAENYGEYGEVGVFEAGLREWGVEDSNIKAPEPPKEVAHSIAEEEGEVPTLAYFILRKLPQILEAGGPSAYPFPNLYMLADEQTRATGLPAINNPSQMIKEFWNDRHSPELQIVPGSVATPELIAALRRETTFFPILKVAGADRSPVERVAVSFNIERQLGFVAALADDLLQDKQTIFAGGRMHTLALTRWLEYRTDADGYACEALLA